MQLLIFPICWILSSLILSNPFCNKKFHWVKVILKSCYPYLILYTQFLHLSLFWGVRKINKTIILRFCLCWVFYIVRCIMISKVWRTICCIMYIFETTIFQVTAQETWLIKIKTMSSHPTTYCIINFAFKSEITFFQWRLTEILIFFVTIGFFGDKK